jgi:hypothetical protein
LSRQVRRIAELCGSRTNAWQAEFAAAMRAAGHAWFSEHAGLLGHIARKGARQSALINRTGMSKQAMRN